MTRETWSLIQYGLLLFVAIVLVMLASGCEMIRRPPIITEVAKWEDCRTVKVDAQDEKDFYVTRCGREVSTEWDTRHGAATTHHHSDTVEDRK